MATNIVVTTKEELPSFIKKKHELAGLLKDVKAGSKEATTLLRDVMNDAANDLKVRVDCAKTLVGYEMEITSQINKDQMNRLIAEIKVKPGGVTPQLTTEEEEASKLPMLDFNTIREVN